MKSSLQSTQPSQKMRNAQLSIKIEGVLPKHSVSLCFISSYFKHFVRSSVLTQVLHQSHNTCITNRHLCSKGEKNGAQKRTKVKNHDTSNGAAAAVGKKARLRMKRH